MNRRQAIWLVALFVALICLLAGIFYADGKGLFGELGALLRAVLSAIGVVTILANFLGMAGAAKESSKKLAFTLINKRASRIAILVVCFGGSAALLVAATHVEPPPPTALWACQITRELPLAAADARFCPRDPGFDRRQSLALTLRRAGALSVSRTLVARASDRGARSVYLDSSRGGRCSAAGPDSAGSGEARLELRAECAHDGAFQVNLHLCYREERTSRLDPADLEAAAELMVIEGESPHDLQCEDRTGGQVPIDAGGTTADAGPSDAADAGPGPANACPDWTAPLGPGQSWAFVRVSSDSGLLTHAASHLAVHVAYDEPPGDREQKAQDDDPCAVSNHLSTATQMTIRAEAPGFSSREQTVAPATCTRTRPCALELPRSLPSEYYMRLAGADRLVAASELPAGASAAEFAAHVADDAVARARFFRRPLAADLEANRLATGVPVNDQVTSFAEKRLGRRCDAACGDDPRLDPAIREVLRDLRRRGDPFLHRTPPASWRLRALERKR